MQVFLYRFNGNIVHKFDARRRNTGFNDLGYDADGLFRTGEDGQQVQLMLRLWQELQRGLCNNPQGAFRADDQLVQTVAGRTLFERCAEVSNFSIRQNGFNGIHLVTCRAIADGLVATGVGSQVATDETTVCTTGIAGIHQSLFLGCCLDISRSGTGFGYEIHTFRIDFQDPVHPFHEQDNTAVYRNGTGTDARTGTARRDRNFILVGHFHNSCHFFCTARRNDDFR